ncbi:amidohydrolase family protein [uncultured Imperialibacter sp.]|uniref:amidohydrolase family protein n=1 Tax=uncultured Imperialibacter sp. TaxID=1672639 RepID=UPI0030D75D2B|tara:strand:+ start:71188 stop:72645 length:1458 start_codon:yes stop_codon:yes gene_type:complete
MKNPFVFVFLLVVAVFAACKPTDPNVSGTAILITNAHVVDVATGQIAEDKALLIDNGRIVSIGDGSELSALVGKEDVFDAGGRYVIPGLWDMHVHIEGEDLVEDNRALLPLYVAYGITTVRDCASDLGELVLAWRDSINNDQLFGPQIFTAGRKLEGINSIWKGDLEIANEEELRQMLDKLDGYNVDFVKITENTLPGDLFLTSVREAKKRGYKVTGHVPYDLSVVELATAGFSAIEHASYMLRLGSDDSAIVRSVRSGKLARSKAGEVYNSSFNQDSAFARYKMLAKQGVAVTPTLIGGKLLAYLDENDHQSDAYLKYLTDRFTSKYQWRIDRMAGETPEQKQGRKDRYQLIAEQLPYLHKAGVTILAGSDAAALNTFVYPAQSLHEELVLFQEAGLEPLTILQTATSNGAKFFNVQDNLASIAPGMEADLVILNSNPLDDISATQDIFAVVNDGEYLSREKLDELLQQVQVIKEKLDKERKTE